MKNRTYNRCSQIVSTVRRVFAGETDREHSNIALDRPASSSAGVRPAPRDQSLMPSKQRRRRDDERLPAGGREQAAGRCQEEPVNGPDRRPTDLAAQHRELVS